MTTWVNTEHKEWYTIRAPSTFGGSELGETIASEGTDLIGQRVKTSLNEASSETPARKGRVSFKIADIENTDAWTELVYYELPQKYRNESLENGAELISFTGVVSDDGYTLEGELLVSEEALDSEAVRQSIADEFASREMDEVVDALVHGSLPVIDDDDDDGTGIEINSLSVTSHPHNKFDN